MLRYEQYDDILTLKAVPDHYDSAETFFPAYQATRLLQKSKWLPSTFDKKAVAQLTWSEAEAKCKQTNDIIRQIYHTRTLDFSDPRVPLWISQARRKIRYILRGISPFAFLDAGGFGPGADSSTVRGFTSAYNKLCSSGSVTRECSVFLDFLAQASSLGRLFQWDITHQTIITDRSPGNRVTFVPKDAKTDRSIAVEPRWNIFFQKGMGQVLRAALKREGVDLDDQSRNQQLARIGAVTNELSTIDLKSASDTVAKELVHLLLPEKWASVLDRLRSRASLFNKRWVTLEKWSSMGNGYTFELESLIFYALLSSVTDFVSVYGDDLVVPSAQTADAIVLLEACGFQINREKSFSAGNFRESCGGDFFGETNVTPIYWKEPLHAEGTLRLANQITRLAGRTSGGRVRDRRWYSVWRDLVHRLPEHFRYPCPTSIASGLHESSDKWIKRARWGWDGWHVRVALPLSQRFRFKLYDAAVLSQHFSPSSDGYVVRDRIIGYRVGEVFIPSGFEDLGPWT
jgi:chaperonin cofactor prefoldin